MSDVGCGIRQRNLESTFAREKADEYHDLKGIVAIIYYPLCYNIGL
jgi:hypothetical protein